MSKIDRFVGNLLAFAANATGTKRTVFGDVTQSDVLTANINSDFLAGWENGLDLNGFPPEQFFNAIGFTATQLAAYLHQVGVAEWDSLQEYHIGSIANSGGILYASKTNNNIGNSVTDSANWKKTTGNVSTINSISGLILSNDTDTDHDINITAGQSRDSTDISLLELSTEITKQIDATWAVGDDAGGLFSGSVAVDTWYHVFLIRKDSDGSIDAGFDTSVSAANIPGGYTAFRRIGTILTDGSSNILAFNSVEIAGGAACYTWDVKIQDLSATPPATINTAITLSVPTSINPIANIISRLEGTTSATLRIKETQQTDTAPSGTTNFDQVVNANSQTSVVRHEISADSSAQIDYRAGAGDAFFLLTIGWTDRRVS